ncbi:hypothetical protein J7L00_06685 [Candidatus Bathyarchaeota archaeon]|nr:hypothetical protein [Candidatus Bathyarchaeota archaeon]
MVIAEAHKLRSANIVESLTEKIREAAKSISVNELGVSFSGGVDSSILAVSCRDLGKKVTLITIGFSSMRDIEVSREVSRELQLPLLYKVLSLEELEEGIASALKIVKFDRLVLLELAVCFYFVFKIASEHGIRTVASANGLDELFCGYDLYRRYSNNEKGAREIMKALIETARRDKVEIDKVAALWNVNYESPFLSERFVRFALNIPLQYKIRGENDELRKHVLREAALKIGVPRLAAMRRKKAFQYSSGIHKAIGKLARRKGYTKKRAKDLGYSGEVEAYIKAMLIRENISSFTSR